MSDNCLVLTGKDLSVEDIDRITRGEARVEISEDSWELINKGRQLVFKLMESPTPIYGLNTGVGANKDKRVTPEVISEFNRNLILSHCVSVKPEASEELVRATMLCRLNTLMWGRTGIQPEIVLMYKDFLNNHIHPVMPERGSSGASDLGPLAHIGLAMIGEGKVNFRGERISAAEALEKTGLKKIILGPKDGLAIVSSNALSAGMGALAFKEVRDLLDMLDLIYALSIEGFKPNIMFLDPRPNEYRPLPGQTYCNQKVRQYLEGSYLWKPGLNTSLAGSLSFKAGWAVHGSVRDALEFVEKYLGIQLNSSDDCPCLLLEDGQIVSCPNYVVSTLALAFEMLSIALAQLSKVTTYRILKLIDPRCTGLPRFLTPSDDVSAFATIPNTVTSLNAENRHLSNPVTTDYIAVAGDMEDHATNCPYVIMKVRKMIDNLRYIIGIEAMFASQAVDLRDEAILGKGTKVAYDVIRQEIPFLDKDRTLSVDIEKAYNLIKSGKLLKTVKDIF